MRGDQLTVLRDVSGKVVINRRLDSGMSASLSHSGRSRWPECYVQPFPATAWLIPSMEAAQQGLGSQENQAGTLHIL